MADEEFEIVRGNEAKGLLGNKLLNEALDAIELHFDTKWRNSQLSQTNLREEAFRMLCAISEFKKHLTHYIETGKMASVARAQREVSAKVERELTEWDGSPDGRT